MRGDEFLDPDDPEERELPLLNDPPDELREGELDCRGDDSMRGEELLLLLDGERYSFRGDDLGAD